jgi:3'-5' exoribonuclease
MTRAKPPTVRLCELASGQSGDFFAQLSERARSQTRDGKPFYSCRFRDARRTVTCMVWADGGWYEACERDWQEGQFYKIRGTYAEHERYGAQIEIHNLRLATEADRADGFDPAELVDRSRYDSAAMLTELRSLAEKYIADAPLRKLVLTLLDRHAGPLQRLPATQRNYYPFCGGLLEHLLSVTHISLNLVETFAARYKELKPPLNRDLVVAGAILHEIGRVVEFTGEAGTVQQTVEGRLFGHLLLGRDLVRATAQELGDVNPELLRLLEHIIITHLTLPEWGSPRLPLVPECLIIHHADDVDAKVEMYVRCLTRDKEPGACKKSCVRGQGRVYPLTFALDGD